VKDAFQALMQTAEATFELRAPFYEFGFSPLRDPVGKAAGVKPSFEPGRADWKGSPVLPGLHTEFDRLEDLTRLPFPDDVARTVACGGALEHVVYPVRALEEMVRILAPGGIFLMASKVVERAAGRTNHLGELTPRTVQRVLGQLEATLVGWLGSENHPHQVFAVGCKRPAPGPFLRGLGEFMDQFPKRLGVDDEDANWWRNVLKACFNWTPWVRSRSRGGQTHFALQLPLGRDFKQQILQSSLAPPGKGAARIDLSQ